MLKESRLEKSVVAFEALEREREEREREGSRREVTKRENEERDFPVKTDFKAAQFFFFQLFSNSRSLDLSVIK